jgi:hypothetical protein
MDPGKREKLARYFRNANPFMWGVISGNKRAVFTRLQAVLQELGEDPTLIPDPNKTTYAMVTGNLLAKLGIETVLTDIVANEVERQLTDRAGVIDFLRAHWLSGTLPRWQTLQSLRAPRTVKQKVVAAVDSDYTKAKRQKTSDILDAFVEVNTQYEYVHGWTVFAGLWFEEIEPLLGEAQESAVRQDG